MSCICGGALIEGPFGAGLREEEYELRLAPALEAFLRAAGPASEETMAFWVTLRNDLARKLALAFLLESGQVHVNRHDETGKPLLGHRARPDREEPEP
jgi:hypothetical protein